MASRPLFQPARRGISPDLASPASVVPAQRERDTGAPRPAPWPAPWPADPRALHAATGGDSATRIAVLARLGRTAGNSATAQLVRSGSRQVQREPPTATSKPTGDATAAVAEYMLANARFTGVPRLQEIAKGGPPLSNKDKKTVVKPVQTALLDVGYTLLRYKDDGDFGSETRTAIEQFRADSKITDGEGFNASAMKALDKRAPAPGKLEQHYLDYGRLFADGKLDVTLALGYDEGGSHERELPVARAWFEQHRMTLTSGGAATKPKAPDVPASAGADAGKDKTLSVPETWTGKQSVTYPDATGKRVTKDITLSVTLIPPGTGAKAAFAKGLNESELTLYSGHARRGTGPDFDPDKSAYENFVIGVNSALHKAGRVVGPSAVEQSHYVLGKKNDLEQLKLANAWDAEKYRVWFFAACSSIAYVDEFRGGLLPGRMDRHNLDIFGTTQAIPIAAGLTPVFSNLEGILAAETMEQIVARMQRSSFEAFRRKIEESDLSDKTKKDALKAFSGDWFMREGAADNQVAPGTP